MLVMTERRFSSTTGNILRNTAVQISVKALLALYAAIVFPFIMKSDALHSVGNSIFSVALFGVFFHLFHVVSQHYEKRRWITSAILGFLFSVLMVFGKNVSVSETNSVGATTFSTWVCILGIFPVFSALTELCFRFLLRANNREYLTADAGKTATKKTFFVIWAIIFVAWIPSLLASYPGVYAYDCVYQINYYRNHVFSLHHPIAHTYLLGFFVIKLGSLFGSYEAGMCCYSIFQMLCLSATFSTMYTFFLVPKLPKIIRIPVLLMFILLPIHPIMAFSGTKDVLFSALFALLAMQLLYIAEKPERFRSVKRNILLIATALLMIAFRNQGIYIVVATFIIALLFFRKYWKNILIMLASVLLLYGIYSGPITKALGGVKANALQEMMSVPCAQLSRVAFLHEDAITPEELEMIKEYIPKYDAYGYNAGIADLMKNYLNTDRLKSNPTEFLKLYIKVGLKCPNDYFNAFARLSVGYWYPDMNYRDWEAYHPYWEYYPFGYFEYLNPDEYLLLEQTPVKGFGWLNRFYYNLTYQNSYQYISVVSMLFSSGLPLWVLLTYIAYCIYRKQYQFLVPAAFVLLLFGTLMLGPVVLYRYVYPAVLTVPLLSASAFNMEPKEKDPSLKFQNSKKKRRKKEKHG